MLKLQKVKELNESNLLDTILYIKYLKDKGYPFKIDSAFSDVIDVISNIIKMDNENATFDRNNVAYALYNRLDERG